jgi:hypothetical protein
MCGGISLSIRRLNASVNSEFNSDLNVNFFMTIFIHSDLCMY